jgi:hypothetical protein
MIQRNGVWLGYYGGACLVSTPAVLSSTGAAQVTPSQCGITLPTISTLIATTSLAGVTGYRFRVTNLVTAEVQTIDRTLHYFALTMLTSYNYGTQYSVEVALKNPAGTYSAYGAPCNVSSPAVPGLTTACDTVIPTKGTNIATASLGSVTSYRFEITKFDSTLTPVGQTILDRPLQYFNLNMLPTTGTGATYSPNTVYGVRVALFTAGSWSPFGDACEITSPAAARATQEIVENNFSVVAYPNPYDYQFGFSVQSTSDSKVSIKVYDMIGKLVEEREVSVQEMPVQEVGSRYPSGVYNVVVSQDGEVRTLRVIKR